MLWLPLFSTVIGAVIALSGTLLSGKLVAVHHLSREREDFRRTVYVDFSTALDAAHFALRSVAQDPGPERDLRAEALAAIAESGLHRTRESLLMFSPVKVSSAGESAFLALIEMRRVVQQGENPQSAKYHSAYHTFAERIWNFRLVVRKDVGVEAFTPGSLGHSEWSEREECSLCRGSAQRPD
jgi:hypothetical protein